MSAPDLAQYWPLPPNFTNEVYEPSDYVKDLHSFHELFGGPNEYEYDVDVMADEEWAKYYIYIAVPFVIMGILCFLGFFGAGLCKCCKMCCCASSEEQDNDYQALELELELDAADPGNMNHNGRSVKTESQCCSKFFYLIFAGLVVCGSLAVCIGNTTIQSSVHTVTNVASSVQDIITDSELIATDTQQSANAVIVNITAFVQVCDVPLPDFVETLEEMVTELDGFNDTASDARKQVRNFKDIVEAYYPLWYNGTYAIFAFVCVVVLVGVMSIYCSACNCLFNLQRVCAVFLVTILFCITGVYTTADIFVADFCMEPDTAVVQLSSNDTYVAYYTSCVDNPWDTYIVNATTLLQDAYDQGYDGLEYVTSQCADDLDAYEGILQNLNLTYGNVADARILVDCSTITPLYDDLVYSSVCTDLVNGMYFTWVGSLVVCIFLVIVMACRPGKPKKTIIQQQQQQQNVDMLAPVSYV